MSAPVFVSPAFVRTMAAYNGEMNTRLYTAAGRLSDEARRLQRGAFWDSIHGTFNHLLWADQTWMARFDGWPPPAVASKDNASMIADFATRTRRPESPPQLATLTDREREVTALVGAGLSNDQIAERLFVSPLTAKTHVSRAMVKLGARDRAQLVVFAYESGLVTPGWIG